LVKICENAERDRAKEKKMKYRSRKRLGKDHKRDVDFPYIYVTSFFIVRVLEVGAGAILVGSYPKLL
jgi:hypothetical protein